jgi:type II secretory pathway pseudopilin PulG
MKTQDHTDMAPNHCLSSIINAKRKQGMTLVEVMVTMLVTVSVILALFATILTAYQLNHKARLRDNARAVLRTYVDQFQRLAYSDEDNVIRMLFQTTTEETGHGLFWGGLSDKIDYVGAPTTLEINIGSPGAEQRATVTRRVSFIDSNTGNPSTARITDAAGFILMAEFKVSYSIGRPGSANEISQSMSTLRLID